MVDLNTLNSWNTSSRTDKIVYIGLVACIADSCKHLKIIDMSGCSAGYGLAAAVDSKFDWEKIRKGALEQLTAISMNKESSL